MEQEIPLHGGNVTVGLVRVGATVRRPARPWSEAVDALLEHLRGVGFAGAPRPLGRDGRGRQVLEFAPGTCPYPDDPDGLLADDAGLRRAARLIRDFHDASAEFTPPPGAVWGSLWEHPLRGGELIAHHDLAPWNLVADGPSGRWTLIDWDAAGPGSRVWDLGYALKNFAPLFDGPRGRLDEATAAHRIRVFADAYGLDEPGRRDLAPMVAVRCGAMADLLREGAARGEQPWRRLWEEGHADHWTAAAEYAQAREESWLHALLA